MKKDNLKQFYKEFPSNPDARVKALKSILEKEGLIDQKALDEILDTYQNKVGPLNGAKIVAKAWANKKFKEDLINNTDQVLKDMDLNGRQGEHVVVVENTETVHNLIVCTLCSCYPWPWITTTKGTDYKIMDCLSILYHHNMFTLTTIKIHIL